MTTAPVCVVVLLPLQHHDERRDGTHVNTAHSLQLPGVRGACTRERYEIHPRAVFLSPVLTWRFKPPGKKTKKQQLTEICSRALMMMMNMKMKTTKMMKMMMMMITHMAQTVT